jgi:tungstate transport system ATP-binding protein
VYGEVKALDDISLEINEGRILGISGHSGAGKTTLLRILAGLELPSRGEFTFKGTVVTGENLEQLRKRATMIFQTPLFLKGDVSTNLSYGLRLRKASEEEIRTKSHEVLKKVRLEGYESRIARKLSGGEQQRVALARALMFDPEVLLLDEPVSNLDQTNAKVISDIIVEEAKHRDVIISTHDFSQLRRLTEITVRIDEGRVTEYGNTREVMSLSNLTENVFTGHASLEEGVYKVDTGNVILSTTSSNEGRTVIHVRPQDIILSKEKIETSARNQFKGVVSSAEEHGTVMWLKIDVGEVFTVQITKKSFFEMGLNVGTEIYISFKASSVIPL